MLREFLVEAVDGIETSAMVTGLAAVIDVLARYAGGMQVVVESVVKSVTGTDNDATLIIEGVRERFRRSLRDNPG